ncbi:hypothetical protein SH1V18_26760 [Vallitalea longa]|uniref:Peptidase M23 domain-containing protein n=1 Tax=Vallitalea longa TaxID=2936439 RepID=A0A9W6DEH7_9FIRM|nr:stalk domain-containing protein [Vallitalea longa]GKX30196.1 hypothetical protein SH1V18_26760 [Vallitalea longa]
MGSLTVDLNALGDVTEKFKDLIEKSNITLNDFNSQKNCIDFDIAERDNIRYDLNEVSKKLKLISEIFITYDRQINDAIDTYADTEEKLKSFILELDTSDRKESTNNNAKPADVTVGKVKVRDSKVTDGVTTGYLVDIIEGLGGTAEWDGKTRTTTVKLNGKTIVYDLKNMKDGVGHASDGTTFTVKDGHIHVGVREVSEKSGANIKWSPNSKGGVTVDINYTYASVSKVTPITKDNGDYGELWVGDDIVILEQKGNRSHIRYPGKYHQETAWVDNDKLNIGVRVEKTEEKEHSSMNRYAKKKVKTNAGERKAVQVPLPDEGFYENANYRYFPEEVAESDYPNNNTHEIQLMVNRLFGKTDDNVKVSSIYGEFYNGVNRSSFKHGNDVVNLNGGKFKGIHEGIDIVNKTHVSASFKSIVDSRGKVIRVDENVLNANNKIVNVYSGKKQGREDVYNTISVYYENENITVSYLHAKEINVKLGQYVELGQELGKQGYAGLNSPNRSHVHIEVKNGRSPNVSSSANDLNKLSSKAPYSIVDISE